MLRTTTREWHADVKVVLACGSGAGLKYMLFCCRLVEIKILSVSDGVSICFFHFAVVRLMLFSVFAMLLW